MVAFRTLVPSTLLSAVASTLLLLLSGPTVSADGTDQVEARFEIFGFAGLHLLTSRTIVEEGAGRYRIATDLDTRGLAQQYLSILQPLRGARTAHQRSAIPSGYRAEMRRNGLDRHYGLDYRGDGAVNVSTPPVPGRPLFVASSKSAAPSTSLRRTLWWSARSLSAAPVN